MVVIVFFIVNGKRYELSREDILTAVDGVEPEPLRCHVVQVGPGVFPVKQVISLATGIDRLDFTSMRARDVLRRLGFEPFRCA